MPKNDPLDPGENYTPADLDAAARELGYGDKSEPAHWAEHLDFARIVHRAKIIALRRLARGEVPDTPVVRIARQVAEGLLDGSLTGGNGDTLMYPNDRIQRPWNEQELREAQVDGSVDLVEMVTLVIDAREVRS